MEEEKHKDFIYNLMNNKIPKNFNILSYIEDSQKPFYGFIFLFDLSKQESFDNCIEYFKEIQRIENDNILRK